MIPTPPPPPDDKQGGTDLDRLDIHRFVLFFGHQFNERTRFFSELEVEHGLVSDNPGAVGNLGRRSRLA